MADITIDDVTRLTETITLTAKQAKEEAPSDLERYYAQGRIAGANELANELRELYMSRIKEMADWYLNVAQTAHDEKKRLDKTFK